MAKHTSITRRHFLAGTAVAGAALAVPWYFHARSALAFYQSMGLQKFAQPLRGVGPGGSRSRYPIPSRLPSRGSPITPSPSGSLRISYTPTSARRSCGATTRSCHWAAERNPRGTLAASSWRSAGSRSSSRLRTRSRRSTSCRSTPAPTSLMRRSARTRPPPTCTGVHTLDQRRRPLHLVYPRRPVRPECPQCSGQHL